MIELKKDALVFSFPDVHARASFRIDLQRTLRIPDDGREYALPPGLGRFPLRHVDDFAERLPEKWLRRGGVALPMYQSEAMWLNFGPGEVSPSNLRFDPYPFAVKIATGKVNAVTGDAWTMGLQKTPQDYVVVPVQPWLDGYCVTKELIRQFVAMELGAGFSVEEQLTGAAEHGGIQIVAYPMKPQVYERRFPPRQVQLERFFDLEAPMMKAVAVSADMGLAPGGRMRQEIYDDPFDFSDWDTEHGSRCFVHLTNALVWRHITGEDPPTVPPTAAEYTRAGLPWFEYYDRDRKAIEGSKTLEGVKSVKDLGEEKGHVPLPENEPVDPDRVIDVSRRSRDQVREGAF